MLAKASLSIRGKPHPLVAVQILRGFDNSITAVSKVISRALGEASFTSEVVFLREEPCTELDEYYDTVHCFGLKPGYWGGFRLALLRRISAWYKSRNPDLIVTHRYKELIHLLLIRRFTTIRPLVAVIHGERDFNSRFRRAVCSMLIDDHCHFIAVSDSVNAYIRTAFPRLPQENLCTINNGIDFEQIAHSHIPTADARRSLSLPPDATIYGSVGRLVATKGTETLVRAFIDVARCNSKAVLVLMGEGQDRPAIEKLRNDNGLEERILLLGNVPDAPRYLKAIDYFVFPSVREGFGLALVEAIAARVPVIFSDIQVFRNLTEVHRYVAAAGDVDSLIRQMKQIAADPAELRLEIVEKQLAYASSRFSIARTQESYRAFFSDLSC
jgi:glycosyltransferase involved in cell wall biosynthesis